MFALFFACQIYTRLRASLLNQSKCKPSIEINICSQDLQEIIIYKTIKKRLYCNQQSETIIIFHVSMRKPVLQICADRPILGVEFQISQNKHTRIPGLWTQVLNAGL